MWCLNNQLFSFGTSSSTLALLTFYLTKSPDIQVKLRDEITDALNEKTPTYAQLNGLRYLDAVVKETLRFHPVGTL
jgi:cytochrome P450